MSSPVSYHLADDVGIIRIDNPPVNALSQPVRQGILDAVRAAQQDASRVLLVICAGRSFIAGADIREFGKPPMAPQLPDVVNAIENSKKLVVAAIHGTALGGGLEIALGCHYRLALASARVGLPEVRLGLIPGAGGTQRVPRLVGVKAALDLMTSGKPIPAAKALDIGLVDKVVVEALEASALAWCRELVASRAPRRKASGQTIELLPDGVFADYRSALAKRARGQLAPQKVVDAVEAAMTLPFPDGLARERQYFVECLESPQSAAMRHLFFAEREAARIADLPQDTPQRTVSRVGVIGAGTMGGGIAMSFANAGFDVTLLEIDDEALKRGLETIDRNYGGSVKRGKLSEAEAVARRGRIEGTTAYSALADVDLAVEAVFENLELKREVFAELDAVCRPGAILATNTSYQDVNLIAAATRRPEDVIGLHFFSPAHVMKLLEVVRADATADDVLATCMALGKKIGKVPVMAGVCYGFIGNRMLGPYLREAQLCLIEGATPAAIDTAMEQWGMAMGPLAVADLAGLDVGYKARQGLPVERRGDPRSYRIADVLVESGRLGQKSGAGFYVYDPDTRRRSEDPAVLDIVAREAAGFGVTRREIDAGEIVDRLIYALVNEGMRIVEEGIAQRPGDIDVVYAYGYGFPAFRGGPMFYADTVGLNRVLERIEAFRRQFGDEHWMPAPLLVELAGAGKQLSERAISASD